MPTERLFSIENLPDDEDFLRDLLAAVNARLGNRSVNLHDELVENLEVARNLRNQLCGVRQHAQTGQISIDNFDGPGPNDRSGFEDVKDSSKVASVRAFTDIIEKLVKMQEIVLSQQGVAALQGAIIDALLDVDPDLQRRVMAKFRERVTELEGQRS